MRKENPQGAKTNVSKIPLEKVSGWGRYLVAGWSVPAFEDLETGFSEDFLEREEDAMFWHLT
jgi:hypothetical protein